MRCPDCSKMVSYGDPEVEIDSEEISVEKEEGKAVFTGEVTCNARLMLPCADCSTELKETTFEFSLSFEHTCKEGTEIKPEDEGEDFEVSVEGEGSDRYQSTDLKTGKPIPSRYQKHFFVAEVRADITCPHCKDTIEVTDSDECQASGMDELT